MAKIKKKRKYKKKTITMGGKKVLVSEYKGVLGKYCRLAKKFLPANHFYVRKSPSGFYCLSAYSKEEATKRNNTRRDNDTQTRLFYYTRSNAKIRGMEHNLEKSDLVVPDICPILGIQLSKSGNGMSDPCTPSVDRVDNAKGYIKGNIVVCSWRANFIKRDATLKEIEALYFFMKHHKGE